MKHKFPLVTVFKELPENGGTDYRIIVDAFQTKREADIAKRMIERTLEMWFSGII